MRGNALNEFKSVECQIMDWADDAAYSLNDIVDGVKAGFLTLERIERWAAGEPIDAPRQQLLDALGGDAGIALVRHLGDMRADQHVAVDRRLDVAAPDSAEHGPFWISSLKPRPQVLLLYWWRNSSDEPSAWNR